MQIINKRSLGALNSELRDQREEIKLQQNNQVINYHLSTDDSLQMTSERGALSNCYTNQILNLQRIHQSDETLNG
jgi:hypothetical protein